MLNFIGKPLLYIVKMNVKGAIMKREKYEIWGLTLQLVVVVIALVYYFFIYR